MNILYALIQTTEHTDLPGEQENIIAYSTDKDKLKVLMKNYPALREKAFEDRRTVILNIQKKYARMVNLPEDTHYGDMRDILIVKGLDEKLGEEQKNAYIDFEKNIGFEIHYANGPEEFDIVELPLY